jgi:hypothetical protein
MKRAKAVWSKAKSLAKSAAAKRIALSVPGIGGIFLLSLGAGLIFVPAGIIVGGILLLMVDRNI